MRAWFYRMVKGILEIFLCRLTRFQVRGKENIPRQGAILVVANHVNNADAPIVVVSLDRKAIFMAKDELFRYSPLFRYLIRYLGAFPVHRGRLDRPALRQAEQVLADGLALVIFPEGTRSRSGQLRPAFPGAARIAARTDAPILPIGIIGTEKISGISWLWHRPRITVNIGPPFRLPPVNGKLRRTELSELTNDIMNHIAELLPADYRGNYRGRKS